MEKYNFRTLFTNPLWLDENQSIIISKVEIPRIQRDYAQGRLEENGEEDINEKGKRFIENVFNNLNESTPMELDFVYGAISEDNHTLLPLDGQQRLTTLFLLYWYIGNRELADKAELTQILKKFSYETRTSSRKFCEKLAELSKAESKLVFDTDDKISEQIKNLSWFPISYIYDPTIKAMLNMIDKIHKLYGKSTLTLFSNLDNIQFNVLVLNHFNLTDELYIKMNARGKQLTNFENFKADLIGWMKKNFDEDSTYNGQTMPHYMAFSLKMDNEWTNFLWNITKNYDEHYRNAKGEMVGKLVDPLFLALFYRYFFFECIISKKENNQSYDDSLVDFLASENSFVSLTPFIPLLTKDIIQKFEVVLDKLSFNADTIFEKSVASWDSSHMTAHYLIEPGITQPQRVVLYAIIAYLDHTESFDVTHFSRWMRVVWNIVENTDINSWTSTIGALLLIKELSQYSDDIYGKLPSDFSPSSSKNAMTEEKLKIAFINTDNQWEKSFITAESHPFFKGSISFLMTPPTMTREEFEHRTEIANTLFDVDGIRKKYRETDHILLRALISQYSNFDEIVNRSYTDTDTDDKEHYLKKMLTTDKVVRTALSSWCSLDDETAVMSELSTAVSTNSQMDNTSNNPFASKMHEDLYKNADLQNWMQLMHAITFAYNYWEGRYYVSRKYAWYDRVLLDSYRGEMIDELTTNYGCKTAHRIGSSKYYCGKIISTVRTIVKENTKYNFIYEFHPDGYLRVGLKKEDSSQLPNSPNFKQKDVGYGWYCRKKYIYTDVVDISDITPFLKGIENDVFDINNPDSFVSLI